MIDRDELLSEIAGARVRDPRMARPESLTEDDWREAGQLARVQVALQYSAVLHGPDPTPPLERDRVAAMLGLVPDPHLRMDGRAVARRRKSLHLSVSDLASRLARRGWEVTAADVFRWEVQGADDVPPAVVNAVAKELSTTTDHLTADRGASAAPAGLAEAAKQPRFQELARRLARLQGLSAQVAESSLRSVALATVMRGESPDSERWLDILGAYVSALESRRDA